jgi:hypothetical protein
MYTTKDGKKYGSAYVGKKKDEAHGGPYAGSHFGSYTAGPQPGEENENEHSTSEDHGEDKVNTMGKDKTPHDKTATSAHAEMPSATVQSHGAAHTTHVSHKEDGTHTVSSEHPDGHVTESDHGSAEEAHSHAEQLSFEAGGEHQADSPKKREHYPQVGAESQERNYEVPDLI